MPFSRGLDDPFVDALNSLHNDAGGEWWRRFLCDPEIFVAIRYNSLNAYYRGCSLAKITFPNGTIVAETHYKYLVRSSATSPMIAWRGDDFHFPKSWKSGSDAIFIENLSDTAALKRAANRFAGGEKKLVAEILKRHESEVIDVEIALTNDAEAAEDNSVLRLDLAALRSFAGGVEIVFYEAKLFKNKELRAQGEEVSVIKQIESYQPLIEERCNEIRFSYLRVAQNIEKIKGMSDARRQGARNMLQHSTALRVCKEPVLVIGGFDRDQQKGKVWESHYKKLMQLGLGRVIAAGEGKSINLFPTPRGASRLD